MARTAPPPKKPPPLPPNEMRDAIRFRATAGPMITVEDITMELSAIKPDFSAVEPEAIKELHRQAETCLQGTIQFAIAADHRATTLTGIFGTGSVALLAAAATVLAGSQPNFALVLGAGVTALFLLGAALSCFWASRPVDFSVAGYEPRLLAPSVAADPIWMVRYATEDMQRRIDFNRAALERAARWVLCGAVIALVAILAGVGTFFAVWLA